ncbi:type 1 glutamine amidotransferase [Paracoccus liaowanqingii]|uniref:Type 1 glutamine amidotransferase n=1 Tax=Paracoccus liaowanqingii TaxID=2560053 RepID=A0A4P7HK05_9RHOB|nr:type 1 glutamine amidotransferase [Paracoccus liaowanqingii]
MSPSVPRLGRPCPLGPPSGRPRVIAPSGSCASAPCKPVLRAAPRARDVGIVCERKGARPVTPAHSPATDLFNVPLRVLIVASETPSQRSTRRRSAGTSSDESYARTLRGLRDDLSVDSLSCVDGGDAELPDLSRYDGVFFAGSPIQMHEDTPETRAAARFMAGVFQAGVPSFGSCAGLQIAAVAAGGATGPRTSGTEAAFARNITMTDAGRTHPLLQGRPAVWSAPAMHSSVVTTLPPGAVLLARNADTPVEAVEIRHGAGLFWGVQYHPEITLAEIAASLRRQAQNLVDEGLARDSAAIEDHAARLEALNDDPHRRDLAWQLGLDAEVTDAARRTLELRNFLAMITERSTAMA